MPSPVLSDLALAPFRLPLHDRWVLAARIAQRLAPAARAHEAFATAEVRVAVGEQAPRRPAVAVVPGPLPVQPLVRIAPLLVVELAPVCTPQHWLGLGVAAVWSLGPDAALVHEAGLPARRVPAPGLLRLVVPGAAGGPALALRLPVHDAGAEPAGR